MFRALVAAGLLAVAGCSPTRVELACSPVPPGAAGYLPPPAGFTPLAAGTAAPAASPTAASPTAPAEPTPAELRAQHPLQNRAAGAGRF